MAAKKINWRRTFFALGIAMVAALLAFLALRPATPFPPVPLPTPNGYDDFLKAGRVASATTMDYRSMSQQELREFVIQNTEALKVLRAGLAKDSRVPIEFSVDYLRLHMAELPSTK